MSEGIDNWLVQVRKGLLEYAILQALAHEERYAYELVRDLVALEQLGLDEGTAYPLLSRLRLQGWLAATLEPSPEGPPRKVYALTKSGRKALDQMRQRFGALVAELRALEAGKPLHRRIER
jgi:PadR family transcriptional regulator, regulatory protein PadR